VEGHSAPRCTYIASPLVRLSTVFSSLERDKRLWSWSLTITVKVPIVKEICPGILLDEVVLDCDNNAGEGQDKSKEGPRGYHRAGWSQGYGTLLCIDAALTMSKVVPVGCNSRQEGLAGCPVTRQGEERKLTIESVVRITVTK
jgi:hypothetical protein